MSRRKRMETVQEVMEDKATQAAGEFGRIRERLTAEQGKLEQLRRFRAEYQGQLGQQSDGRMSAFQLQDFNAFISRIDAAIEQQQRTIQETSRELERARSHWSGEKSRADALDKVVQKQAAAEQRDAERREQSQADELARRLMTRHRS